MSVPQLPIPEGNVNTHIGIGYNATGVVAVRLELPNGSILQNTNLSPNIGMPFKSSDYPETNTLGSYNYQPIEIVRDHLISSNSSQKGTKTFEYDPSPTGDKFPPYSQVEVEGVMHKTQTTNDIDDDLSFFKLTFQNNFYTTAASGLLVIQPTVETIGGEESILNSTRLYYFTTDYYSPTYGEGYYYLLFKYTSKSYSRRLLTHTTFL